MKLIITRILVVLLASIVLIGAAVTSASASGVAFSTPEVTAKNGRLIYIDMRVSSGGSLAAAIFRFRFDNSVIEYRSCKTDHRVAVNDMGSSVCISYLCENGNTEGTVFTLCFKAVGEGNAGFSFSVEDCVDYTPEALSVGSCTAGSVIVTGRSGGSSGVSDATQPNTRAAKSSSEPTEAGYSSAEPTGQNDFGFINNGEDDDFPKRVILIIIACAGMMVAAAIVVVVVNKRRKKDKSDEKE